MYAQLLFKVYDLIQDMKNTEECAEVLSTLTINEDVKQELDLIIKLIQAQYMVNRLKEDEDATKDENIHQEHLEKDQRFQKWFQITFEKYNDELNASHDEIEGQLDQMKHPRYVNSFGNELFVCVKKSELKEDDLEYLQSAVQPQEMSYFFDCVILGLSEFVIQEYDKYARAVDRRQSHGQIINGFSALLYACYYGHFKLV